MATLNLQTISSGDSLDNTTINNNISALSEVALVGTALDEIEFIEDEKITATDINTAFTKIKNAWVDVSQVTATDDCVVSPYKYINSSGVISTGTIPIQTYLQSDGIGTLTMTAKAGYYPNDVSGTCVDENLMASNIKAGTTIFGVYGGYEGCKIKHFGYKKNGNLDYNMVISCREGSSTASRLKIEITDIHFYDSSGNVTYWADSDNVLALAICMCVNGQIFRNNQHIGCHYTVFNEPNAYNGTTYTDGGFWQAVGNSAPYWGTVDGSYAIQDKNNNSITLYLYYNTISAGGKNYSQGFDMDDYYLEPEALAFYVV